jgi:hypothetical protein
MHVPFACDGLPREMGHGLVVIPLCRVIQTELCRLVTYLQVRGRRDTLR